MADILCPNCGMPNPDDQSVCSFCRQPLRTPSDKSSIRPGDMPTKKTTAELEGILPEWLREARQKALNPTDEERGELPRSEPEKPAAPQEETPADWLAGLEAAAHEEEQEELPEWMRGSSPAAPAPAPQEKPEETFPRRQEIRWETELPEESTPSQDATTSDDGIPFWMKGLEEEPSEEKNEVTDWLSKQDADSKQDAVSPFEVGTFRPNTGELLSWMRDLPQPSESTPPATTPEPSADEALPDWISNLGRDETPAAPPPAGPAAPEPTGFDWLKEEASKPFAPFPPSQIEPPPAEDGFRADFDLPDWMKPTGEAPAPEQADNSLSNWLKPAEEATTPQQENAGFSDWLNPETKTEIPPAQEDAGLPDWMKSLVVPSASQPEEGGLPDWMKPAAESQEPAAAQPEENLSLDWLTAPAETEPAAVQSAEPGLPDWMRSDMTSPAQAESEAGLDLPDWMSAAQSSIPQEAAPAEVPSTPSNVPAFVPGEGLQDVGAAEELFSGGMPDWLSNIAPTGPTPVAEQPATQAEDISPADLPSWVQAMRPVETAMDGVPASTSIKSQPVEDKGPFAGLRGILPALSDADLAGRPRSYSIRLQPTQDQMEHSALLEQMLASESVAKPFRAASNVALSQRALRWAITGILFMVIAAVLFTGLQLLPLPVSLSPEGELARSMIVALPNDAPVLMIFDYEPALAGEMEAAAASFVDQMLTLHHPRLSVLSTSPTGVALAELFLSGSEVRRAYQAGSDYVSLGYLPGESSGVLAFAMNPREALPGQSAWNSPAAQNVNVFSDYALILLLTDRSETARAWVEQTGAYRNGRPFVIVSSAQSAPMIQPYLLSGQVNGLVSGLYEGAAFEQNSGSFGSARRYWDAYNLSILIVCVLIVIGGLWNLVLGMRSRRQGLDEG